MPQRSPPSTTTNLPPIGSLPHPIPDRGVPVKKHPLISILVADVVLLLLGDAARPQGHSGQFELLGFSGSLVAGSLVADNISIADDPAFSSKPFLQAKSLHIGVQVAPLLSHRQLLVTSFVADSPSINLVHNAQGTWRATSLLPILYPSISRPVFRAADYLMRRGTRGR
jgi:hypothetical protein